MKDLKRVLIKLSGEALSGGKGHGLDEPECVNIAGQIKTLKERGMQIAIVIGGGNFWRGRESSKIIERTRSDQVGMLGTVMNCIYFSEVLETLGVKTRVFTPFVCGTFSEPFSKKAAVAALEAGEVVFFAGGTGHPYFSTDTGTSLRAIEIEADAILLAKAVDGIYDSDPKTNPDAKKFDRISIEEVVDKRLKATDLASSIMCMENHMPMLVFGLSGENSIIKALTDEFDGTYVYTE
ncbi:MAG: UMP kinase [Lachnospiraceae bacterium]|nr:UMP kinase [Lachnospiraceae bacterium]